MLVRFSLLTRSAGHFNEVPVVENCFHFFIISPFNFLFAIRSTTLFESFSIRHLSRGGVWGSVSYLASSSLLMLHSINAFCDKIFKKFTKSEMKDLKLCSPCPEFKQNMFPGWLHFYWPRVG